MKNSSGDNDPREATLQEKATRQRNDSTAMTDRKPGGMLRNVRTFDSLRSPGYRFYFFSMVGQWGSANMQMATQTLLIYRLTGSAALLGLMALASAIPTLALSLYGGAIADRMQKKQILQMGQAAAVVLGLVIAVALQTGYMSPQHPGSWWILIVTSALQGVTMAFMMPARSALIPELVSRERIVNAVSLSNMGMNTFQLIAPAVAGFLIDTLGFEEVYYIMSGLNVIAVILTSFIPVTGKVATSSRNTLVDVREGLKYIWGETTILLLLFFITIGMVLAMPIQMLMPIFTDDILKVGATGLGLLMSVSGAGALVGSIILASLPGRKRGIILLAASLLMSLAIVVFAYSRSWYLSLAMMVFMGLGRAGNQTAAVTLLQTLTNAAYLGRVMSIFMMNFGLTSLGAFFAGILAQSTGAPLAVGGFGLVLLLLSTLGLLFVPRIRKLD